MAESVGIRELKNQATQILRHVREERAEYIITLRGEPVAALRPFEAEDEVALRREQRQAALDRLLALAEEIGKAWKSDESAVETLERIRDEEAAWPS